MANLSDQLEDLNRAFNENNYISFIVDYYTEKDRNKISDLFEAIFHKFGYNPEYLFNVISAVNELVLNGIKANIKYLIFKKEIKNVLEKRLNPENLEQLANSILREPHLRESIRRFVVPERMKKQTNQILNLEHIYLKEKSKLSPEEIAFIEDFKKGQQEENIRNLFSIGKNTGYLEIIIRNDSPIMKDDLSRIEKSRKAHKKLAEEFRSHEYFSPDFLDVTESAGFGIAMADEIYYSLNLNPLEHLLIETHDQMTKVTLKLPDSVFKPNI